MDAVYKQTGSYAAAKKAADVWLAGIKASGAAGPIVKQLTDDINRYLQGLADKAPALGQSFGAGYAGGIADMVPQVSANAAEMAQAAADATAAAQKSHSPSLVAYGLGEWWGQGYVGGIASTAPAVESAVAHLADRAARAVTNARAQLKQTLGNEHSFVQQLLGDANLSNVPTVATGYTGTPTGPGNIGAFLDNQKRLYAKFDAEMRHLKHEHLAKALREQIEALGPVQGSLDAQQILSGAAGSISHLNADEAAIQAHARNIGQTEFGRTLRQENENLRHMLAEQRQTNRLLGGLAADIAAQLDGKGGVNITFEGRRWTLDQHDAREILRVLRKYERHMGKK